MPEDIAPALHAKIERDFIKAVNADAEIERIRNRIAKGKATHRDTQRYAIHIGDHSAAALTKNIREEILPDGRMYFNIAQRTVRPQLVTNYEMISETAGEIQKILNEDAGIGLKPQMAKMDENRLAGLINKMCSYPLFSAAAWLLAEPIKNWTQHVADDYIGANADFQARSGILVIITREVYDNCCPWCDNLAGSFTFGDQPADFYQRHEFCRCMITSKSNKSGRASSVYSERMREQERQDRISRINQLEQEAEQRG